MKFLARLFGRGPSEAEIAQWAQSQHGEDRHVLGLLSGASEKVVVDVGANDGRAWSNSYLFGKLGYRLILVEPMPAYAEKCRALWTGNPKVTVVEAAVSTTPGEATFFVNLDADADLLAMRSSLGKSNVPGGKVEEIKVRVERLDAILERAGCPADYAFLSVDAEGFDLEVLQSAGLDRFRPEIICVEDEVDFSGAIRRSLWDLGYALETRLGSNGLYRRLGRDRMLRYHHPPPALWIDRFDAAEEIDRRIAKNLLAPHTAAELREFERQGYVVLPGVVDEALLRQCGAIADAEDPHGASPAVRDIFSHPRVLTLMSGLFDADPLLFASRSGKEGLDLDPSASAADLVIEPFRQAACFVACADGTLRIKGDHRGAPRRWKSIGLRRGQKVLLHAALTCKLMAPGYLGHFCPLGVPPTYFLADERLRGAARHNDLAYSSAHFPV